MFYVNLLEFLIISRNVILIMILIPSGSLIPMRFSKSSTWFRIVADPSVFGPAEPKLDADRRDKPPPSTDYA